MPLKVTIALNNKGKIVELNLPNKHSTLLDLKHSFSKNVQKLSIYQQSFKLETADKTVVKFSDNTPLIESGYKEGLVLKFKDLGPQIGYRTVFVIEYLGPILIMLLYASRPAFIYGTPTQTEAQKKGQPAAWPAFTDTAKIAIACWIGHFVKRELETLFLHKFSRPTMPLPQLFINCAYYYTFSLFIGYFLCSPTYTHTHTYTQNIGLPLFLLSELGNLYCHYLLATLRTSTPQNTHPHTHTLIRPIPTGFLFNYVSCPNYFCEIMSWVGFSIYTHIHISYLFALIGGIQMLDWAKAKHKAYIKQNGDTYKKLNRKAMIPFVV